MKNRFGSAVRAVLIILMGATTVMTLLGAVGTACLAWNGDKYGPAFKWIIPYMTNYQVVVYLSLAAGVAMAIVAYAIARGDRWFYLGALITLLIGGGTVAYQMYMTSTLRNITFLAAAPANVRFYITLLTLIVFLLIRFTGLWNRSGLGSPGNKPGSAMGAGGAAMIVSGLLILTAPWWAGPTHMLDGYNLVLTLEVPLLVDGLALVVGGTGILLWPRMQSHVFKRTTITTKG